MDTTPSSAAPFSALFRVDANPSIGNANLMRMMALARALRHMDAQITFITGDVPLTLKRHIEAAGCNFIKSPMAPGSPDDADLVAAEIKSLKADWTIIDGDAFGTPFYNSIKQLPTRLMTTSTEIRGADLILDQTGQIPSDLSSPVAKKTISGLPYLLMGQPNAETPARSARKNVRFLPKRILVSLGACDIHNWTLATVRSLEKLDLARSSDLGADVIVSHDYPYEKQLTEFCRKSQMNVRIHRNRDRLNSLLPETDLAIVDGSSVCFELAHMGVPAVAIATDNQHTDVVELLHQQETLLGFERIECPSSSMIPGDTILPMNIHSAIGDLVLNRPQRQLMSDNGKELLDGRGAERIARRMCAGVLTLRGARLDDAATLQDIAREQRQRGQALAEEIATSATQSWLETRLKSRHHCLWIAEDKSGRPLATVALELSDDFAEAQIGVAFADEAFSQGLGPVIVEKVTRQSLNGSNQFSRANRLIYLVKSSDNATCAALEQVGFELTEPTVVNGNIALQYLLQRDTDAVIHRVPQAMKRSA